MRCYSDRDDINFDLEKISFLTNFKSQIHASLTALNVLQIKLLQIHHFELRITKTDKRPSARNSPLFPHLKK